MGGKKPQKNISEKKMNSNTTKEFKKGRKEGGPGRTGLCPSCPLPSPAARLPLRRSTCPSSARGLGVVKGRKLGAGPPGLKGLWFWGPAWAPRWEDGMSMHCRGWTLGVPNWRGAEAAPVPSLERPQGCLGGNDCLPLPES